MKESAGNSPVAWWLGLLSLTAEDLGSIPGRGTEDSTNHTEKPKKKKSAESVFGDRAFQAGKQLAQMQDWAHSVLGTGDSASSTLSEREGVPSDVTGGRGLLISLMGFV